MEMDSAIQRTAEALIQRHRSGFGRRVQRRSVSGVTNTAPEMLPAIHGRARFVT